MACAKIPVSIDTGGAVPYDVLVDWHTRGPWIPVDDLYPRASARPRFHDALTEEQFQELGCESREWFERWLTPEGLFGHFRLHLERFLMSRHAASRLCRHHSWSGAWRAPSLGDAHQGTQDR